MTRLIDLWKETPTSVRNTSRFLPLRLSLAASRTLSSVSQHATQGSVFTRANERSSFRGLKSFFFCFARCEESHEMMAVNKLCVSKATCAPRRSSQSVMRCVSILAPPSNRLTAWLLKTTISRRIVTDELASGSNAVFTYCCHKWQMRSTIRKVSNGCKFGSDFASAASTRACALNKRQSVSGHRMGGDALAFRWQPPDTRFLWLPTKLGVRRTCFWPWFAG